LDFRGLTKTLQVFAVFVLSGSRRDEGSAAALTKNGNLLAHNDFDWHLRCRFGIKITGKQRLKELETS
jgi:hypothetical protein